MSTQNPLSIFFVITALIVRYFARPVARTSAGEDFVGAIPPPEGPVQSIECTDRERRTNPFGSILPRPEVRRMVLGQQLQMVR